MALFLNEDEVSRLLSMREALDAVRGAFRALAAGRAANSPRARVRAGGAMLNVMPAAIEGGGEGTGGAGDGPAGGYLGLKSYSIARSGARFLLLLYGTDGTLRAVMEADRLGQIRTGAASGVATEFMARPESRVVAVMGSGWQARSQLAAVAAVRPINIARVFSRGEEGRRAFARDMERSLGIEVIPSASAEEAVRGADVVITITTSRAPVVEGRWLEEGVHVNAAGSNYAHRRELDGAAVARAAFIAVDSIADARIESGDLLLAIEEGRLSWDRVHEFADVVSGACRPRTAPADITLFKSNGIALEDVAAAAHVYEKALREGVGRELAFGDPR